MSSTHPDFNVRIFHSISEIDSAEWDQISGEQPFQSYRWYQYGEMAMSDCPPTYIFLDLNGRTVARAALWLVRSEPLPLPPGIFRNLFQSVLDRWPLLICRSPLSFLTGLILPEPHLVSAALQQFYRTAHTELQKQRGSFLIFDFLEKEVKDLPTWPSQFTKLIVSDPGTIMQNRWDNLDSYLASGNKKDRQHYKRSLREIEKQGIKISSYQKVPDPHTALNLMRNVEKKHGSPPNPWIPGMLENLEMINGTFLAAHRSDELIGCGLLFEDNHSQMTATLGLADDVPFLYFQLMYASLKDAFERKVKSMRWGSGAYEVKQRLGFELETNNNAAFTAANPILNALIKFLIKVLL